MLEKIKETVAYLESRTKVKPTIGILTNLGNTNIAFSPSFVFGNITSYNPIESLNISFLTKFVGEQYMGNIDSENSILASYFVNDLNAVYSWQPNKWIMEIQWSLVVNNLLNKQYESNGYFYTFNDTWSVPDQVTTIEGTGYYPQAGINFITGVMLQF